MKINLLNSTNKINKLALFGTAAFIVSGFFVVNTAKADTINVNFESGYATGTVNNQDGWTSKGSYDQGVVDTSLFGNPSGFGTQAFRISNAITSGSFGDQTFVKPLTDSVGEAISTFGSFSTSTKQNHFESQFDIASATTTQQQGLVISVSPDRGDGSRLSYLRFEDMADGIHVHFDDVQGTSTIANFVDTDIATITRTPHTIKLTIDTFDGPSNDIVKVYIDGMLKHVGTSWENYYRYDHEAAAEQTPRVVKTLLIRAGGSAALLNSGSGFLFDNISLSSSNVPVSTSLIVDANLTSKTFGTSEDFGGSTYYFGINAFSTLKDAISAANLGGTISLMSDITVNSQVTVNKAITLDGTGHHIYAPFARTTNENNATIGIIGTNNVTIKNIVEDGTNSTNGLHGINIFEATSSIVLDNVTVSNNNASGITINGSNVTVNNIITKNNAWGGINADQATDAPDPTILTVTGTSTHTETNGDIWVDNNLRNVTVNDMNSQYASAPYTHNTNIVGSVYKLKTTTVTNEAELRSALNSNFVSTIVFGSDITIAAQIDIAKEVTIDGAGYSLKAPFTGIKNTSDSAIHIKANNITIKNLIEDGTGTTGNRGINIYKVTGILLDNVTASNNYKNGIVVNGSVVTVNNIITINNGWGGIDVDLGGGVTSTATLTVNGVSLHSEKKQIFIDDTRKPVSVIDTNNQYSTTSTSTTQSYFLNTAKIKTPVNIQKTSTAGDVVVTVNIPSNNIITGNVLWNGILEDPIATTTTIKIDGFNTAVSSAIAIGSNDYDLSFTKGVRILFAGQKNKFVGWYNHAGTFNEITATCNVDNQATGDLLSESSDCKINSGNDLVVWTKHFTTFTTFTKTAIPAPAPSAPTPVSGGGGGGGGNYTPSTNKTISSFTIAGQLGTTVINENAHTITVTMPVGTNLTALTPTIVISGAAINPNRTAVNFTTPQTFTVTGADGSTQAYVAAVTTGTAASAVASQTTNATIGQVLGVSTFNFTATLRKGSKGDDVSELQTRLAKEGIYSGPITGYFGALTETAVKAFQKKYSIATTGFVGTKTMAQLNSSSSEVASAGTTGQVLGASTSADAEKTAALKAQLVSLMAQLVKLLQAQATATQTH